MLRKVLSVVLTMVILMSVLTVVPSVSAAAVSGKCGDNVTWSLDSGELTISGTGKMSEYYLMQGQSAPWYDYREEITTCIIVDGVTRIGAGAFASCSNLSSVSIPDSVTGIGRDAFSNCSSLSSIAIPDSVTGIGHEVFVGCSGLTSITIPGSLSSISWCAFADCTGLTHVTILDPLSGIDIGAFSRCTGLKSVTIPKSMTRISDNAFDNCSGLEDVYYDGSEEDWEKISIGDRNSYLKDSCIHYNYSISNELDFSRDVWYFKNFSHKQCYLEDDISSGNYRNPYIQNLKPSSRAAVLGYFENGNNGHCFGMSATVILQKLGLEDLTKWPKVDWLHDVFEYGVAGCRICYYQAMACIYDYEQEVQLFSRYSVSQQLSILANKANRVKSGGNPVMLCFGAEGFGEHAVVAYAFEQGPFVSSYSGKQYDHRILIYDCNSVDENDKNKVVWSKDYCLLFNEGSDEWEIPAYAPYNVTSSEGAYILCATDDTKVFDGIDDFEQEYDLGICPIISADSSEKLIMKNTNSGESWVIDTDSGRITGSTELLSYRNAEFLDANNEMVGLKIVLPDPNAEYVFETESGNASSFDLSVLDSERFLSVESDSAKGAVLSTEGTVTIKGNKGEYEIIAADNSMQGDGKFDTFTLEGYSSNDTMLSLSEKGIELDGENICGSRVKMSNNTDTGIVLINEANHVELSNNEEDYDKHYMLGDADANETIESVDATLVQRKIADIETPYPDDILQQGDADGNGELELIDATAIQYYLANMKVPYLVGVDVYNSSQSSQHGKKELHYYANGGTSYGYDWSYSGGKGIVNVDCSYDLNARQYDFVITGVSEGTADIVLYYSYDDVQQNRALMRVKVDSDLNVSTVDYEYQMNEDGTVTITDYIGVSENVVIPSKIDGYTVTTIGSYAFDRNRTITTVKIPNTVTKIKNKAFYICPNLKSADLPDSLDNYSAGSIYNCIGLERLNVSRTNPLYTSIDGVLYSKDVTELVACPNAKTEIDLPDSLTYIQPAAFEYCANLKTVVLPETVRGTLSGVFRNCTALESVNIPEGVYKIEDCFKRCTSLKSINLPQSVKEMGTSTFSNCTALESITLPNAVKRISSNTFEGCSNLTTVTFSNAVADIDSNAFARCTRLNRINFYGSENDWTSISVSDGNDVLKTVEVRYLINPVKDYVKPYLSLTYNAIDANRQNVKLTMTDNVAIKRYGIFRDAYSALEGGAIGYYEYYNTTAGYVNITIDKPGTYYFIVQDNSGNSSVERSLRFEKYLLDPNGGTVETDSVLACWDVCSLPVPVRNNYQFIGWSKEKPKNYTASASETSANDLEEGDFGESTKLYANWMPYGTPAETIKPTVSIDCSGQSSKITLNMSDNTGIMGYYWGGSSDYRKNIFVPGDKTSVTNYMLNPYTNYLCAVDVYGNVSDPVSVNCGSATMDANGGFYGKKESVGTTMPLWRDFAAISVSGARGKETTPEEPIRSGYTFVGWAETPYALTGEKTIVLSEEGTYYAVWEKDNNDPNKVHYYADGGDSWGYDWESSGGEGIVKVNCYYSVSDRRYDFEIIGVNEGSTQILLKYKENVFGDFVSVSVKVTVDENLNVSRR